VENFLLEPAAIQKAAQKLLLDSMPFDSPGAVEDMLKGLAISDKHILPFTRAIFDAEVAKKAKKAWDHVYKRESEELTNLILPEFEDAKISAIKRVQSSIEDGTWKETVKGRDLLKAFCSELGISYIQFRNLLISELVGPPDGLISIVNTILEHETNSA